MTVSTQGLALRFGSRASRAFIELLSSMRFAIALLSLICIASVMGTVLRQGESFNSYVSQFGPFWAELFGVAGLYSVYSAWWFVLILAFLVTSTALCIARNTPRILSDLRTYKEHIRAHSLHSVGQRAQAELSESAEHAARRIGDTLVEAGWKVRLQAREVSGAGAGERGWMVAAKIGAGNKIGYLAAHSAIVLICLGGLLDGDLVLRAQMWLNGKTAYRGGGMAAEVAPEHRLGAGNPTFRGNLAVTEGTRADTAILSQPEGVLLQELPFALELKKFVVEYYSTGMPKLFASDIVIHDRQTGAAVSARVEVNHPVSYRGVEIFQSGFQDGGSRVKLKALPLGPSWQAFDVAGQVGGAVPLLQGGQSLSLELTELRPINVENTAADPGDSVPVRRPDWSAAIQARLGAANKAEPGSGLRNVGPSITYKLRDNAGQAREFHNYMLPVDVGDGVAVFLMGLRDSAEVSFSYLRVPVDEQGTAEEFFRLRAALQEPALRAQAVQRYVAQAVAPARADLKPALTVSATRALDLFAGARAAKDGTMSAGFPAIAEFLETQVPSAERAGASEVLIRILNGVLLELAQLTRERAAQKPLDSSEKTRAFMTRAVIALSDAHNYPAPLLMQLVDFTQVQSSVFQVTRSPGKIIVYLGCTLLILGVLAMLYIRERRLWVWLAPQTGHVRATLALWSKRRSLDGDGEFKRLKAQLMGIKDES